MKLFDRSVDLAQFPEGTSLYPVCRAWMRNEPHNTNMAPRVRTPTPEPGAEPSSQPETEEVDGPPAMKREKSEPADAEEEKPEGDAEREEGRKSEEKTEEENNLYKMPAFTPLEMDAFGNEIKLRIPSPPPVKKLDPDFLEVARGVGMSKHTILNEHMANWTRIRRRWRNAAAHNEERYKESMEILKEMFEK